MLPKPAHDSTRPGHGSKRGSRIVAGVCDPGAATTAGLREASYRAGPTVVCSGRHHLTQNVGSLNHARLVPQTCRIPSATRSEAFQPDAFR